MITPTVAQQKAGAIAPIPFAALSCLSSMYVIFHILHKEPKKRERIYHRLVLAMNVAVLLASSAWLWSSYAVPEGTPNFYMASGTIQTCTANGEKYLSLDAILSFISHRVSSSVPSKNCLFYITFFAAVIWYMGMLAVPTYYGSLR